jgi:P-type Ca2+ transporter type 2C
MITGISLVPRKASQLQVRLRSLERVITGPELDHVNDEELRRRVATTNISARVVPEQKLRLIEALKANGEVVA